MHRAKILTLKNQFGEVMHVSNISFFWLILMFGLLELSSRHMNLQVSSKFDSGKRNI
jgi:hypothetical protein